MLTLLKTLSNSLLSPLAFFKWTVQVPQGFCEEGSPRSGEWGLLGQVKSNRLFPAGIFRAFDVLFGLRFSERRHSAWHF